MNLEDKSPADLYLIAADARANVDARRKQSARLHADRARQLSALMEQIRHHAEIAGDERYKLTPEAAQLLLNPTKGLS